jgi:hypothetical protein
MMTLAVVKIAVLIAMFLQVLQTDRTNILIRSLLIRRQRQLPPQ